MSGAERDLSAEGDFAVPAEGELLSRISMIEAGPLAQRAEAYAQIHHELSATLSASDSAGVSS